MAAHSLAEAASSLHMGGLAIAAAAGSALVYVVAERRGREAWSHARARLSGGGPYRTSALADDRRHAAPPIVRAASVMGFTIAMLFVPGLLFALTKFEAEGIAFGLFPAVTLALVTMALVNARCAWLLLTRPPESSREATDAPLVSIMAHVFLLMIVAAHLTLSANDPEAPAHVLSSPLVYVGVSFAVASMVQAGLMLVAARAAVTPLRFVRHARPD
jgi:hypothetical protein